MAGEIGATLREARMRAKVDISEVEAHTKIRAKYLRAIENEEWALLPGPTFAKTFLRTYAEFLGLDAKLLVDEYKQRYERVAEGELTPIAPLDRRKPKPPRGPSSRTMALAVAFLGLAAALFALSRIGGDDEDPVSGEPETTTQARRQPPGSPSPSPSPSGRAERQAPRRVRLQIVATGAVYVCLENAAGETLVAGEILAAGDETRTFRSRRFRLTLGTGNAQLRVNGRVRDVPDVQNGIGYRITARERVVLPADQRPTCT